MVTPVKGMSTRAAQAERTRQQILETAQRLFAEQGYDATSLQMIADEMGLTKAAVYYHFPTKSEILHEAMRPGIERIRVLLDEAALIRGRRARIEHLVNGYVDFLVKHRHYAVMASTEPAAKRNKLNDESESMSRRAMALLFGDNPTASERLSFYAVFSLHDSLSGLVDLTDEELREALHTTTLHILRVPSRSNAGRGRSLRGGGCLLPPAWTGT
jgi:AcrR family transcriptional regulator